MKALLLFIFQSLKFVKFSKVFISAGSIILSMGTYAVVYGWCYAAGLIGLIFVHEMGHYFAARQKNLPVGLPTFIPFVGAWIELKEQPLNAEVEAYVAYAGPLVGTIASFAFYYWGFYNENSLALALAQTGFLINLFNLIPLSPLDGGRITAIISPKLWFFGAPLLVGLWIYQPSPMLIIVAILACPQLIKAWNYDARLPEIAAYYDDVKDSTRLEYAILYLGLTAILGLMIGSS